MSMVCGLDLHRGQITFDALEVESGEVWRGRLWQPDRARFRRWLTEELGARAHDGVVAVAGGGAAPDGATWSRRSRPLAYRRRVVPGRIRAR